MQSFKQYLIESDDMMQAAHSAVVMFKSIGATVYANPKGSAVMSTGAKAPRGWYKKLYNNPGDEFEVKLADDVDQELELIHTATKATVTIKKYPYGLAFVIKRS
jgi:hypothetical protein